MSSATSLIVSIITIAMISVLVTRPGVSTFFTQASTYLAGAIKAALGN